ncbi:family 43 glycosylhydrolase [Streptomyces sp. SID685]|uniref:family 43 glycosylhydrolase n=1 Tax=Streptomyces sp. SID685 TaxID=2690322 RepID=UPI0013716D77|nr:family 43 glycosylhydrolase [Streptomyces sp. SID685]MYR89101.1 family 43 glycosylhydrolase [Streptomyces sp. SID685]
MNARLRTKRLTALAAVTVVLTAAGLTLPASAAPSSVIANDTVWTDTDGNPILAQGGNVLKVGSTYYWVGSKLVHNQPKQVNLYSSTDLEHWQFVKAILSQDGSSPDLAAGTWLGRPQLVYNPTTKRYVLVVEVNGAKGNNILFASSTAIDGNYTLVDNDPSTDHDSTQVNGATVGDHSVFVDGDKAYLVYVGDKKDGTDPSQPDKLDRNRSMNVSPLDADWTAVAKDANGKDEVTSIDVAPNLQSTGREAPAILKVGSTYYYFASGMSGWNASATSYRTSTDLKNWSAWNTVTTSPASGNSFGTQFEQIIPVTGTQGTSYLYNGDRYSQFYDGSGTTVDGLGQNAWYRLTFDSGGVPTLHGDTDVHVDAAAGTLTGNPVANAHFSQAGANEQPPCWTVTGGTTDHKDRAYVQNATSDNRVMTLGSPAGPVTVGVHQTVSLAAGTYELSFRYKSKNKMNSAVFDVKDMGGSALASVDLNTGEGTWVTKTVPFTMKTAGQLTVGAAADGAANSWINLDDVAIWPAS